MKDVGAFFYFENEGDEMMCEICGEDISNDDKGFGTICWRCEQEEIYPDESLNEVSMGRFDDDPNPYSGNM